MPARNTPLYTSFPWRNGKAAPTSAPPLPLAVAIVAHTHWRPSGVPAVHWGCWRPFVHWQHCPCTQSCSNDDFAAPCFLFRPSDKVSSRASSQPSSATPSSAHAANAAARVLHPATLSLGAKTVPWGPPSGQKNSASGGSAVLAGLELTLNYVHLRGKTQKIFRILSFGLSFLVFRLNQIRKFFLSATALRWLKLQPKHLKLKKMIIICNASAATAMAAALSCPVLPNPATVG